MTVTNHVRTRSTGRAGFPVGCGRRSGRAGRIVSALAAAIAVLALSPSLAPAANGGSGFQDRTAVPTARSDAVRTAFLHAPLGWRECVTDDGWRSCLYGITPRISGLEPVERTAVITVPQSRAATIAVLAVALLASSALVALFWRHLAASLAPADRPARRRRRR